MHSAQANSQAFATLITVRIGDINYGGHLGHDNLVTLLHQARLNFLDAIGAKGEQDCFGCGLIMRRLFVEYFNEAFLGEKLRIEILVSEVTAATFTLEYQVYDGKNNKIARAATQMATFDYEKRKVRRLDAKFSINAAPYFKNTDGS
ncbi:MAG: acyl-CoA thioesterase [Cardiobacteriaceae bacterium]|nr:acyl-CoA thioesterase [Cardiobacteriaceae bacterium]